MQADQLVRNVIASLGGDDVSLGCDHMLCFIETAVWPVRE